MKIIFILFEYYSQNKKKIIKQNFINKFFKSLIKLIH